MFSSFRILSLFSVIIIFTTSTTSVISDRNVEEILRKNNAEFSINLFTKVTNLNGTYHHRNIIISPFSIFNCLSLLYFGSNGNAADEIAAGLKYISTDHLEIENSIENLLEKYKNNSYLRFINRIYVNNLRHIKLEYKELIERVLSASIENIDFSGNANLIANEINDYVERNTNNKITNIINSNDINPDISFLLINAVYFNAEWEISFNRRFTRNELFYVNEFQTKEMYMMKKLTDMQYASYDELNSIGIELPYKKTDMSLVMLLPKNENEYNLKELENKLQKINLYDLTEKMSRRKVLIKIPKFTIQFEGEMEDILKEMGIKTIFDDPESFSNILTDSNPSVIKKIFFKTFIEVNEEGTEAAAATYAVPAGVSGGFEQFIANRPFLFFIKDNSMILFIGRFTGNE